MATIPLQIAERRLDPGGVVQYPQGGEVGRAMQGAGDELSAVAERIDQRQNEMDKFKRLTVENEFDQATANQAAEVARNGPADGAGLHDTIAGQVDPVTGKVVKPGLIDTLAQQYRNKVPTSQRGYFDASLPAKRLQLSGSAASAQYEQEQKYATLETTKIQNGIVNSILQMSDPAGDTASFEAYKEQGRQTILASPLKALAKQAMLDEWEQTTPKALAQAISAKDPGKLRQLFGMAPPTDSNLPAGMRNNNPGNIKFVSTSQAAGVVGPSVNRDQGDPQAVFATPEAGMRAAYELALRKYDGGKTTANQLIAGDGGWTPGNKQAAANIAATMGLGPDDNLNLKDPAQAKKFLRALVTQEHGPASRAYTDDMITNSVSGAAPAGAGAPKNAGPDLPIVFGNTAGRVSAVPDLKGVHPELISRFKGLQNSLGFSLPVVSGFRDPARNEKAGGAKASEHLDGNALDLDVRDKSQAERIRIIQAARAQGFGGIGVYGNSIHIDTGPERAWGASHHSDSLPLWARHALDNAPVGQTVARAANAPMDPRFKGMSPDDMLALANQDDVAFRQKQTADVAQAKVQYAAYKDHIELGIRTGEIRDPGLILSSRLNEGDQATLYEMLKTENKDNAGVDAIISAIGANQKVAINSFDSSQTKIGDKAFGQYVAKVPTENQPAATATYVAATGYIPDQVQAQLRQGAASTAAPALATTLSQADTLEKIAPASFGTIPGSDVQTKLTDYRHMVNDLGMSGEAAAAEILRRADPAVKVNREVLKPKAEEFAKKLTVGDVTGAFDPGIFSSAPGAGLMAEQSSSILAEYREIATEKFYDTNGDVGLAKARAVEDLKKRWNVTSITGSPTLMRMPPELHYPPIGGSYDYLRQDAMATAQAYADHLGQKVENVTIWPSAMTRADIEQKRPPRYRLFYQYSDHGQPTFAEVFAGPWGVGADEMKTYSDEAGKKSTHLSDVSDHANDIELSAEAKGRAIAVEPETQDFIKALNSEATVGAGRVQADLYRKQNAEPAAPAPLTPEEKRAKDLGTSTYDGSQKTGFGNK